MPQNSEINDDLRPEYDFTQMPIVARGQRRQKQTETVDLVQKLENLEKEVSALELAGDIVGCVEAPEDLATNKDYFADFGK
ncbi:MULTISPECIES: hypothetical protein [unclassified Picosynechococcus]|uniref:hypothetical protein n=1 Tax=unclassified Picosynechococcus TaxID=3079910 RepID=UPI000AEC11E4|nr:MULTISPECIES: hypothetical protein [unclassified Picosynechococcus]